MDRVMEWGKGTDYQYMAILHPTNHILLQHLICYKGKILVSLAEHLQCTASISVPL